MSKWNTSHVHLTYKQGLGAVVRQPEAIIGGHAAQRLVEEIAAVYTAHGCRVARYIHGIRVYDCRDEGLSDRSFEAHGCDAGTCGAAADYGRWTKADREKYLKVLQERGIVP